MYPKRIAELVTLSSFTESVSGSISGLESIRVNFFFDLFVHSPTASLPFCNLAADQPKKKIHQLNRHRDSKKIAVFLLSCVS